MWRAPKLHLAAGAFIANEIPLETILMSMLLEQYKKIKRLESRELRALSIEQGAEERECSGEVIGDG